MMGNSLIAHRSVNSPDQGYGIRLGDVDVLQFGVPRSCTRMIYQLLLATMPFGGVMSTHMYIPGVKAPWTICAYRDFRDCVVSFWRFRGGKTDKDRMTESEIRMTAGKYTEFIHALNRYADEPGVSPTYLKYEEHLGRPGAVLKLLAKPLKDIFGYTIPDYVSKRAASWLDIQSQATLAQNAKHPNLMEKGHIGTGRIGQWKELTDAKGAALLTELLRPELQRWGYLPKPKPLEPAPKPPPEPQKK